MKTFILSIISIIGIIIVVILVLGGVRLSSIGQGEHSGFITAVDQNGYIFKNYDVYFKTDNSSSQEDMYCINRSNVALIEQAKEANKARKEVVITYHGVRGLGVGLCFGSEIEGIE